MARRPTRVTGVNEMAGNFIQIECPECGNEQIVFNRPAQDINCAECDAVLVRATGGIGALEGEVIETVEAR